MVKTRRCYGATISRQQINSRGRHWWRHNCESGLYAFVFPEIFRCGPTSLALPSALKTSRAESKYRTTLVSESSPDVRSHGSGGRVRAYRKLQQKEGRRRLVLLTAVAAVGSTGVRKDAAGSEDSNNYLRRHYNFLCPGTTATRQNGLLCLVQCRESSNRFSLIRLALCRVISMLVGHGKCFHWRCLNR